MIVTLKNIQAIKDFTFDLPDKGLVNLVGPNSNGKSILPKVLELVSTLGILDPDDYISLITDGEESGYIMLEDNGTDTKLLFELARSGPKNSSIVHIKGDKKTLRRFSQKDGIREMIDDFGLYCIAGEPLQVLGTFKPIPYVTTTPKVNNEWVKSITNDSIAEEIVNNFTQHTYKLAAERKKLLVVRKTSIEDNIKTLRLYDHLKYQEYEERMTKILKCLVDIDSFSFEEIKRLPKINILEIDDFEFKKINILPKYKSTINIDSLIINQINRVPEVKLLQVNSVNLDSNVVNMYTELDTIEKGECPLCGARLHSQETCIKEQHQLVQ